MFRLLVIASILSLVFFPFPSRGETPDYLGCKTLRTPYDTKYRKVETYLNSIRDVNAELYSPSFVIQQSRIRRYLKMAQSFRFQEEGWLSSGKQQDHWQLPEETERLRTGDCEDLAIWLYCHLLDEGFNNIRFTLGFAGAEDKATHAWITWYERGKTYVLDPSRKEGIFCCSRSNSITYQPCYSYYFDKKWHHR